MSEIYSPSDDSYLLSEVIHEQIQRLLKNNNNLTFLEIGSGSGIHLKTVLKLGIKRENIFSSDINPDAVKECRKIGFNSVCSNLFEAFERKVKRKKLWPCFDLIIFNPPYLPEDSKEPKNSKISTTGGKKGNEIINEFLKKAKVHLNKNGRIFLLASSHTGKINYIDYKKKILKKRKIFFEELIVSELSLL